MILYGSSLSPFVRKVLAFAAEKGIEVELKGQDQLARARWPAKRRVHRRQPGAQDAGAARR
jgi:glutathione S-transferase